MPVFGVPAHRMNMTSNSQRRHEHRAARRIWTPCGGRTRTIALAIDSPGGSVAVCPTSCQDSSATDQASCPHQCHGGSAAYWLPRRPSRHLHPSGECATTGVFSVHENVAGALAQAGGADLVSAGKKVDGTEPVRSETARRGATSRRSGGAVCGRRGEGPGVVSTR